MITGTHVVDFRGGWVQRRSSNESAPTDGVRRPASRRRRRAEREGSERLDTRGPKCSRERNPNPERVPTMADARSRVIVVA
jgi:hypothetical protein